MGQRFIACDREQSFLMPPDLREWLPPRHLAWFVIDAVAEVNLDAFYGAYRVDGGSRPPYDPAIMVALLLYAYARGIWSSRVIERACEENVAFRVLAAQQRPDHATLARFVDRHQEAIAGLFGEVLTLCARSGLVKVGVIAVDGTKVQANASRTRTSTTSSWRARSSKRPRPSTRPRTSSTARRAATSCRRSSPPPRPPRMVARGQAAPRGRARGEPAAGAAQPRETPARGQAPPRAGVWTEVRANRAYEGYRARGRMKDGRRFGRPPDPYQPPATPEGRINVTDPDSHVVKGLRGFLQGYNAQAITNEHQIVLAAEVMTAGGDFGHLE